MLVIPAIDLKGGECVRLLQGRMEDATVYSSDPAGTARGFEALGAANLPSPGTFQFLGSLAVVMFTEESVQTPSTSP